MRRQCFERFQEDDEVSDRDDETLLQSDTISDHVDMQPARLADAHSSLSSSDVDKSLSAYALVHAESDSGALDDYLVTNTQFSFSAEPPSECTDYSNSRVTSPLHSSDDVMSESSRRRSSVESNSENVSPATSLPREGHPLLVVTNPPPLAPPQPQHLDSSDHAPYLATRSTVAIPPADAVDDYSTTATSWRMQNTPTDVITVIPPERLDTEQP